MQKEIKNTLVGLTGDTTVVRFNGEDVNMLEYKILLTINEDELYVMDVDKARELARNLLAKLDKAGVINIMREAKYI